MTTLGPLACPIFFAFRWRCAPLTLMHCVLRFSYTHTAEKNSSLFPFPPPRFFSRCFHHLLTILWQTISWRIPSAACTHGQFRPWTRLPFHPSSTFSFIHVALCVTTSLHDPYPSMSSPPPSQKRSFLLPPPVFLLLPLFFFLTIMTRNSLPRS